MSKILSHGLMTVEVELATTGFTLNRCEKDSNLAPKWSDINTQKRKSGLFPQRPINLNAEAAVPLH